MKSEECKQKNGGSKVYIDNTGLTSSSDFSSETLVLLDAPLAAGPGGAATSLSGPVKREDLLNLLLKISRRAMIIVIVNITN